MKKSVSAGIRFLLALVMGMVYMWFVLSFAWSLDEMSTLERCVGVSYILLSVPVYYGVVKVLRLV